jgi:hypothetical protein
MIIERLDLGLDLPWPSSSYLALLACLALVMPVTKEKLGQLYVVTTHPSRSHECPIPHLF